MGKHRIGLALAAFVSISFGGAAVAQDIKLPQTLTFTPTTPVPPGSTSPSR